MNNEEAIAILRHATDSALFRGDTELASALVCGINALKIPNDEVNPTLEKTATQNLRDMISPIFK